MNDLVDFVGYVIAHTERGECKCSKCCDKGDAPDPEGHTVDMVFFKVAFKDDPTLDEFKRLTAEARDGEFAKVDPFDGHEHNYMELGAWIGDQGLAIRYMALGVYLGAFTLLSPAMLGLDSKDHETLQMAEMGFLAIRSLIDREFIVWE
jgi:hypothetical protein